MKGLREMIFIFALINVISKADASVDEIRVDGDDFVSYDLSSRTWLIQTVRRHTFFFNFKTVNPNGMLIYIGSGDELKDFVMLDLVKGKLRITVNLGDNIPKERGDLVIDGNLTDNIWHHVMLALEGRLLNVTLRRRTYSITLKSRFERLDMNGYIYVGGLTERVHDILQGYKPSRNFKGCLRDVYYHNYWVKILAANNKKEKRYREYGSPKHDCPHVKFDPLSFGHSFASLKFPSIGSVDVNVKMRFRTYFANGVLVSKGMASGDGPFVSVSLIGGKMFLKFRMVIHGLLISLSRGKRLNDGDWHDLAVVVNETMVRLQVDQLPELKHFIPNPKEARNKNTYLLIGYAPLLPNFTGCIHNLRVDDRGVDLRKSWSNRLGNLQNGCNLASNCFPNPCRHDGKCREVRSGGFSCDCERTFHSGRLCQKPIYQRTCQEYKNLGLSEDAYCRVDPDAEGPAEHFKVRCNVTDRNYAVAIISHGKAGPQKVSSAKFFPSFGYYHELKYSVKMELIRALIAQSERCRQFVNFKCFASKLFPPPGQERVLWKGPGYGSLISDHWPGAPAGSNMCACGVNGTCADPSLSCNCDIGDSTWREDEGYVTDKSNLPVTVVVFPPSTAPHSSITVGPLECFGTLTDYSNASEETVNIRQQAARFLYTLCNVVNPTTPHPPRAALAAPDRKPDVWQFPYTSVPKKETTMAPTTLHRLSATEKPTIGRSTSRSKEASPVVEIVPFPSSSEVPETATDSSIYTENDAPPTTEDSSQDLDLSMNKTLAFGSASKDSDLVFEGQPTDAPRSFNFSWQLLVTVVLLVIVFIMFITAFSYFFKKQGRRKFCCGPFRPKKTPSPDEIRAGFPAVQRRSRSGELNLSDVRRSIEAGSYNARTGLVVYGDRRP